MKLAELAQGRDNNFNLIRIIAAVSVLISHSFALAEGTSYAEPLRERLGMSVGDIATDAFFLTSGFLVTASLLRRQNTGQFIWARVLRIFPALLVMVPLTVFVLGSFFTKLPLSQYLSSSGTYVYLRKCLILVPQIAYELPGVFADNPFRLMVNGSIWTLTLEVYMYAILVVVWAGVRFIPNRRITVFNIAILVIAVFACLYLMYDHFFETEGQHLAIFFYMFFAGASFYVLRNHIVLSSRLFVIFLFFLLLSAAASDQVFFVTYVFVVAYLLLYIAYVPSGRIRKYNHVGDYSYGVYIYAFPIQQSVAALIPGVSVFPMMLASVVVTLCLAALSWHFIERRALKFKSYIGSGSNPISSLPQPF